jgi:hypothetical protein
MGIRTICISNVKGKTLGINSHSHATDNFPFKAGIEVCNPRYLLSRNRVCLLKQTRGGGGGDFHKRPIVFITMFLQLKFGYTYIHSPFGLCGEVPN